MRNPTEIKKEIAGVNSQAKQELSAIEVDEKLSPQGRQLEAAELDARRKERITNLQLELQEAIEAERGELETRFYQSSFGSTPKTEDEMSFRQCLQMADNLPDEQAAISAVQRAIKTNDADLIRAIAVSCWEREWYAACNAILEKKAQFELSRLVEFEQEHGRLRSLESRLQEGMNLSGIEAENAKLEV